jgi:squalene synthase HpnC
MPQPAVTISGQWTPEAAYRYCERMARTHYENFTVGSLLLPREKRRHVYAIYGYCRSVDDLGDEAAPDSDGGNETGTSPPWSRRESEGGHLRAGPEEDLVAAYRLDRLDWWRAELEACYQGAPTHPVMVALQETVRRFDIPMSPFLKLIEANRMDQRIARHATYQELLHYCDHSANPVGHLFLYLFGYRDEDRQRLSDATCTALQLANFWQDVARDYVKGRIYLPLEDLARFGYTEAQLARVEANDAFRSLLAFQVQRTREMFAEGARLVDLLEGPVKLDVALFTRGGLAVLEEIQRRNYDVLTERPALSRRRKGMLFLSAWLNWKLGRGLPVLTRSGEQS